MGQNNTGAPRHSAPMHNIGAVMADASLKDTANNTYLVPTLLLNKAENFRTLLMWMYHDRFASSLWENHIE